MDPAKVAKARERKRRDALARTQDLRTSEEPRWRRLRERLRSEGIDPRDVVVATMYNDDSDLDFALLVVRDGRAFGVDLDYRRDEAGQDVAGPEDAWISSWEESDETTRARRGHVREIEIGLELLEEERTNAPDGT